VGNVEKAMAELQEEAQSLVSKREELQQSFKEIDVRLTQIVGALQALGKLLEDEK
jgi:prefoldin subunit 5